MKIITILAKGFSTIFIIAVCIFFVNSQGAADPIFKSVGTLKASKIKKFKVPVLTIKVPVQISDLAVPWRGADIVVGAMVVFFQQGSSEVAKGMAHGQTIKPQALINGSSQGMVLVNIYEVMGVSTGQYSVVSMAVAKLGDKCKILGFGLNLQGGAWPGDGIPEEKLEMAIDQVIPWSDPIIMSPGLEAVMN